MEKKKIKKFITMKLHNSRMKVIAMNSENLNEFQKRDKKIPMIKLQIKEQGIMILNNPLNKI